MEGSESKEGKRKERNRQEGNRQERNRQERNRQERDQRFDRGLSSRREARGHGRLAEEAARGAAADMPAGSPGPNGSMPSPYGGMPADALLLLVDGECAMCRGITRFAAKRDRAQRLRFAALDSALGRERTAGLGPSLPPAGTFVLIRGTDVWTRSEAAVRTLAALDPPWPAVAAALRLVPAKLRDAAYDAVAARRHRFARRSAAAQCPAALDEPVRRRLLDTAGWGGRNAREHTERGTHAAYADDVSTGMDTSLPGALREEERPDETDAGQAT